MAVHIGGCPQKDFSPGNVLHPDDGCKPQKCVHIIKTQARFYLYLFLCILYFDLKLQKNHRNYVWILALLNLLKLLLTSLDGYEETFNKLVLVLYFNSLMLLIWHRLLACISCRHKNDDST